MSNHSTDASATRPSRLEVATNAARARPKGLLNSPLLLKRSRHYRSVASYHKATVSRATEPNPLREAFRSTSMYSCRLHTRQPKQHSTHIGPRDAATHRRRTSEEEAGSRPRKAGGHRPTRSPPEPGPQAPHQRHRAGDAHCAADRAQPNLARIPFQVEAAVVDTRA
jgi:hypothetical protein